RSWMAGGAGARTSSSRLTGPPGSAPGATSGSTPSWPAEKPTYVLQLCFYSAGVAAIQGVPPERMHVLLGIGEQRALRYDDFAAYYGRVRAGFEAAIDAPPATEPYRVDHCSLCQFRGVCAARWDA